MSGGPGINKKKDQGLLMGIQEPKYKTVYNLSLIHIFRTTLSGGKDFITIKEEMGHIESYLQIQKIRYQDILDYEVALDKSLEEYRILKLTLQPLVENALYHGIKNKRGRGHIWVRGYARDDRAVFEIRDDGAGMTQEEMEAVQRKLRGEDRPSDRNGSASKRCV